MKATLIFLCIMSVGYAGELTDYIEAATLAAGENSGGGQSSDALNPSADEPAADPPVAVEQRDDGWYYWNHPTLGLRKWHTLEDGMRFSGLEYRDGGMWPTESQTEGYPLNPQNWNFGSLGWNPSREQMIDHLSGPNHRFSRSWLNTLTHRELESLHDDHHEGQTHWEYVPQISRTQTYCPT